MSEQALEPRLGSFQESVLRQKALQRAAIEDVKANLERFVDGYEIGFDVRVLEDALRRRMSGGNATYVQNGVVDNSTSSYSFASFEGIPKVGDVNSHYLLNLILTENGKLKALVAWDKPDKSSQVQDSNARVAKTRVLTDELDIQGKTNLVLFGKNEKWKAYPINGVWNTLEKDYKQLERELGSGPYVARLQRI